MNENVRWWDATYVMGADASEIFEMVGSEAAIRSWVEALHRKYLAPEHRSIFDHRFTTERPGFKQWGTGYHWLALTAHEFAPGEKQPVEAYSGVTNKTYPTWDDLVVAESHGYSVTAVITRGNKTWPWTVGLYPTKAEATNAKVRAVRQMRKSDDDYPDTTYKMFVRPVWKDRRELT